MNYSNGHMWDEYDKAMSRITALEEDLEKAEARAEAAEAKVAALEAALDGDPHQTATPEQRRAWRASAIRYADKLEAQVAALQAELIRAIDIYKDPAVAHANILNGRIVLPKFYVNITDDFGPVADLRAALDAAINMNIEKNAEVVRLTAALAAANEDAARLAIVAADGSCCVLHDRWLNLMIDEDEHAADCPITLHRARVGGAS